MKKRILALLLAVILVFGLATMAAGAATHTVVSGDNLSKLAEQYLGDRTKWKEIYEANKDIISNPNVIYVGQTLTIPVDEEPGTSSEGPNTPPVEYNDVPLKTVELPESDPSYYAELAVAEAYNYRIIRIVPTLYTTDSWNTYMAAAGSVLGMDPGNLDDASKATLDRTLEARNALVQVKPYSDGINGEVIYLWGDSMPDTTNPDEQAFAGKTWDGGALQDNSDFSPFIIPYLAEDQDNVKGTIITVSGGGFATRSGQTEGDKVAPAFQALGYNVFDLQYRVQPWSSTECALDLQRAIRVVKSVVAENNLKGGDVLGVAGFSAGGGNIINVISSYYGDITPDQFDPSYVCDEIDTGYTSDFDVAMLIYGAMGPLNTENPNIPHLFIGTGEDDPLVTPDGAIALWQQAYANENGQFTDVNPELHIFAQNVHGFGPGAPGTSSMYWIPSADEYIQEVMGKHVEYPMMGEPLPADLPNAEEFTLEAHVMHWYNTDIPARILVDEDFSRYLYIYVALGELTYLSGNLIDNGDGTYTPDIPDYGPPTMNYIIMFGEHLTIWNLLNNDLTQFKAVDEWL